MSDQRFTVSASQGGTRLDVALAAWLSVGRAHVKKLLEAGRIRVDGRRVGGAAKGDKLPVGAAVEVEAFEKPGEETVVAEEGMPVVVLAEGIGWVAVEKPAGVPVHPLDAGETGTLLNGVAARWPAVRGVGEGGLRSGVVHRLDVETSGVVVFAKTQERWERLRRAFAGHTAKKVYRAIVEGKLMGSRTEVMELVVARHRPAKVRVAPEKTGESRTCDLEWRALEALKGATLVEVELGTGFLHQIRVMLAELGHPVVGDRVYGGAKMERAPRQMLHAASVEVASAGVRAVSADPPDFAETLRALRP